MTYTLAPEIHRGGGFLQPLAFMPICLLFNDMELQL